MKKDFIIILPTHSSYIGITKNFLQLFKKNWFGCPFDVVVSLTGEKIEIDGVKNIYNGEDASLIDCLVNAAKKDRRKYYISFLGDAFINKKIDNKRIISLLNELIDNKIDYCSLEYVKNYKKKKMFSKSFRYINNLDRYSHNFTAFVASYDFVINELSKYKTDLDFEKAYLFGKDNFYFNNHLIVWQNFFNLLPSVTKGRWDRINYNKLRKSNPEIDFDKRELQSIKESLVCHIRDGVVSYLPNLIRKKLKKTSEKVFNMEFGVEG